MTKSPVRINLASPQMTADFAVRLGAVLHAGDTLLLDGSIGAGKTHFARSLIQSLLTIPEDVPSPTFTLVQTYETGQGEIWHTDLYRLSGPHDVMELGLIDAFETAICLIEWPDRLGDLAPDHALTLRLTEGDDEEARLLEISWTDPTWADRLRELINDFA